jgi:hypothetical protein
MSARTKKPVLLPIGLVSKEHRMRTPGATEVLVRAGVPSNLQRHFESGQSGPTSNVESMIAGITDPSPAPVAPDRGRAPAAGMIAHGIVSVDSPRSGPQRCEDTRSGAASAS